MKFKVGYKARIIFVNTPYLQHLVGREVVIDAISTFEHYQYDFMLDGLLLSGCDEHLEPILKKPDLCALSYEEMMLDLHENMEGVAT